MGAEATVRFTVDGRERSVATDPERMLLEVLREDLGLLGTKYGCGEGQCGACSVLVDGRRMNACLLLAVAQDGAEITTVEGLAADGALHPLQEAFIERDAFQCGFCTSGQLCSAAGTLDEAARGWPSAATPPQALRSGDPVPEPLSPAEVRERMSGNLCRCGAYPHIVDAVRDAAG